MINQKTYIPKVYSYTIKVYTMITQNEKNILKLLLTSIGETYSINQIAKECNLAPNGAFKILKNLDKEGILNSKKIANIKSYSLNFENEKTNNMLKLALIQEFNSRVKFRFEDLKQLKEITKACIIFGSYVDLKKEPNDLDIFFLIEDQQFNEFKKKSLPIFKTIPVEVHDVLQTPEDLANNLKSKDKVILEILKKGIVLWGYEDIIQIIENEYKRQA